jgi:hypothetical protein
VGLRTKGINVSHCVSMLRPFYGGLGAARSRAEQSENKKPRTEAGLEVGESHRNSSNGVRPVRLFYGGAENENPARERSLRAGLREPSCLFGRGGGLR